MAGGERPGYVDFQQNNKPTPTPTPTPKPPTTPAAPTPPPAPVTPAAPTPTPLQNIQNGNVNTSNIDTTGGALVTNPEAIIKGKASATATDTNMDPTSGLITDAQKQALALGNTPTVSSTQVTAPEQKPISEPTTATTETKVAQNQMTGAEGQIKQQDLVTAQQADMKGLATGVNEDGSINYTGQALAKTAQQNFSNIIDTSTIAGKQLAEALGEGNYTDSKATLKGQLDILQNEFIDPVTGDPKIPSWAAGTARAVGKIAAFGGVTGTAAIASMSQALLEASLPIAQQDSQFFQSLTLKNLDNRQQTVLNTAQTLAKFDAQNLDNRMTAAVENSKAFLAMDLKNLDNDQQAAVINNQARIQSILEDAKAENTNRLFVAQTKNDTDKFYDQLKTQIAQFNSAQLLDSAKFNAQMEDSREQFEKNMSFNIDISNAKWRQTVQLQDDQQKHENVTFDAKNLVDISTSQLNKLWDRADQQMAYVFTASQSEKDRAQAITLANMQIKAEKSNSTMTGIGQLVGSFVGSDAGSSMISKVFSSIFK